MGATTFSSVAQGKTVGDAFSAAVDEAAWEFGHGGYTGTIAEKPGCIELPKPPPRVKASTLLSLIFVAQEGEHYLDSRGNWRERRNSREKARARLAEWLKGSKFTVDQVIAIHHSKWDECIAIPLSPTEEKAWKGYVTGHFRQGDKIVKTYTRGKRGHKCWLFAGWASC